MFQFLNELLSVAGEQLNEDLGNLKNLGLGRMVNAFKQQYGKMWKSNDLQTYGVGKKLVSFFNLGQNSEAIDAKPIKNWAQFKKQYKDQNTALAAIFYVDGTACTLIIGNPESVTYTKKTVGVSWDFSGIECDVEKLSQTLNDLENLSSAASKNGSYGKRYVHQSSLQSRHTLEKVRDEGIFVDHFEGIAQYSERMPLFITALCDIFGTRLSWKILCIDQKMIAKRIGRGRNQEIDPKDLKLFADDIKTRLAKYKNTKVKTVDDIKSFVESVFAGGLKKIKFAGYTYSAIPDARYLGTNSSYRHEKVHRSIEDSTMRDLLSGKPVYMNFSADQSAGEYGSLTVTVKFKNGQLIPVHASYQDKETNQYIKQDIE